MTALTVMRPGSAVAVMSRAWLRRLGAASGVGPSAPPPLPAGCWVGFEALGDPQIQLRALDLGLPLPSGPAFVAASDEAARQALADAGVAPVVLDDGGSVEAFARLLAPPQSDQEDIWNWPDPDAPARQAFRMLALIGAVSRPGFPGAASGPVQAALRGAKLGRRETATLAAEARLWLSATLGADGMPKGPAAVECVEKLSPDSPGGEDGEWLLDVAGCAFDRCRMNAAPQSHRFAFDYRAHRTGKGVIIHGDAFDFLARLPDESLDGAVFDPPYGVEEYELHQIERMLSGGAGIWRIPPSFDGHRRSPLPRFTALDDKQRKTLRRFFRDLSAALAPKLKPGAHALMAGNSFLSQLVFGAMVEDGRLEFRTEIVRLVMTMRGGDRPKLGEADFPDVCSLPRGCYEPWGLFRKPMPPKMTVRECLKEYGTGGLRRRADGNPFFDVIQSERTPKREREVADHPSLKPQSLMRQLVRAILPLGTGVLVDPFAGSGSTVAAAEAVGYECIGVERYDDYYDMAVKAVPLLRDMRVKEGVTPAEQSALTL